MFLRLRFGSTILISFGVIIALFAPIFRSISVYLWSLLILNLECLLNLRNPFSFIWLVGKLLTNSFFCISSTWEFFAVWDKLAFSKMYCLCFSIIVNWVIPEPVLFSSQLIITVPIWLCSAMTVDFLLHLLTNWVLRDLPLPINSCCLYSD